MVDLCQALIRITFMPVCLIFICVFELSDTPKGHLSPDMLQQVLIIQSTKGLVCFHESAFLWTCTVELETTYEGYTVK